MTQEKSNRIKKLKKLIKKSAELGGLEQVKYIFEAGKEEGRREVFKDILFKFAHYTDGKKHAIFEIKKLANEYNIEL